MPYAAVPGAPTSALRARRGTRAGGGRRLRLRLRLRGLGVSHNALLSAQRAEGAGATSPLAPPARSHPGSPGNSETPPQTPAPPLIPKVARSQESTGPRMPFLHPQPSRSESRAVSPGPPPRPCAGQQVGTEVGLQEGSQFQREGCPPLLGSIRSQRRGNLLRIFIYLLPGQDTKS